MVLFTLFLQILLIYETTLAFPQQNNNNVCQELGDYRCVKTSQCYVQMCNSNNEVNIDEGTGGIFDEIFEPDIGLLGERVAEPSEEQPICGAQSGEQRIRKECGVKTPGSTNPRGSDNTEVCCHQDDIVPEITVDEDRNKKCSDFPGYKCQAIQNCRGHLISSSTNPTQVTVRSGILEIDEPTVDSRCPGKLEGCCEISESHSQGGPSRTVIGKSKFVSKCGIHNKGGVDIRFASKTSTETQFGEWPHVCYLQRVDKNTGFYVFLSGASLIASGIVLTAAHYVEGLAPSELRVVCGDWDIKQKIETRADQERKVREITVHPVFNPRNVWNDFAIIHLENDFELDAHINVICLPTETDFEDFDKTKCVATGWGKDSIGAAGEYQTLLQQVTLPYVDHDKCETLLRATRLGERFGLGESFNCAGGEDGVDTCAGDGGGPLFCPLAADTERYVQIGIVAIGLECGLPDVPGIYASIPKGLCFIKWATQCKNGNRYENFYKIDGCENWIEDEIAKLQKNKIEYEIIANDEEQPKALRAQYEGYIKWLEKSEPKMRELANSCVT